MAYATAKGLHVVTSYVQVLQAKREEVVGEIETLRQEAARLNSSLGLKEAQLRNIEDLIALEDGSRPLDASPNGLPERRSSTFVDETAALLAESGKPLHYRQIVSLLSERQIHVPGKDPGANLIAHISRDDRFARVGRGMYGLTEWPSVKSARRKTRRTMSKRRRKS